MKKIRIAFKDYWEDFPQTMENYLILKILRAHYEVEVCDDPDYFFFSVMGNSHWSVPDRCIKIFHTGENLVPDFNACDYAIGFEWMDYGDRYLRFPLYLFYRRELLEEAWHKHEIPEGWDLAKEKPAFCSFVVSNPNNPDRNEAYRQLNRYKKVDSGGRYLNNVGGPVTDKLAFDRKHKFSLCYENGSHPGYTTEKLVEAFAARTVPLYWGDPEVARTFNPSAFVDLTGYSSLEEALPLIEALDRDDDRYVQMLREPAFRADAPSLEESYARLEAWLLHIFEQPLEKAYRRNRNNQGELYIENRLRLDCWANRKALWGLLKHRLTGK
jgi:hypothetical protein